MDCSECKRLILDEILGKLDGAVSHRLREHLAICPACRKEYEDTKWLYEGVRANTESIAGGHISVRLLQEYAEDRASLDEETRAFIERHLASCDECSEDLRTMEEMMHEFGSTPVPALETEKPWKRFWSSLFSRRLVLAYVSVLVVLVVAFLMYPRIANPPPSPGLLQPPVDIAEESVGEERDIGYHGASSPPPYSVSLVTTDFALESGHALHELPAWRITRGVETEALSVPEFSISAEDNFILRLAVTIFEDDDSTYEAEITSESDESVWSSAVGDELLESGYLMLLLDTRSFESGTYHVAVTARAPGGERMTVARSAFRLIEGH